MGCFAVEQIFKKMAASETSVAAVNNTEDATIAEIAKTAALVHNARQRIEAADAECEAAWLRSHAALSQYAQSLSALRTRTMELTVRAAACVQRATAFATARGVATSTLNLRSHERKLREEERAEYAATTLTVRPLEPQQETRPPGGGDLGVAPSPPGNDSLGVAPSLPSGSGSAEAQAGSEGWVSPKEEEGSPETLSSPPSARAAD